MRRGNTAPHRQAAKTPDTKIGIKSGKERKTELSEEKNQKNRKFPAKNSSFRKICLYLQSQNESFGEGKAEKQPRNTRRDAGVVDRAALEMRCTGNCTGGSNPSLSAIKGVNQAFARFTPFFTPKNVKLGVFVFFKILQKNVNYKAIGISMDWQNEPL